MTRRTFPATHRRFWGVIIDVMLNADKKPEPNETFFVDLRHQRGCSLGANPAMITIIDDDGGV